LARSAVSQWSGVGVMAWRYGAVVQVVWQAPARVQRTKDGDLYDLAVSLIYMFNLYVKLIGGY